MRIDLRVVGVHGVGQLKFRTRDAEIGVRKPFGHGFGLGAIHHVVREGRNSFGFGRVDRTQGLERIDVHHRLLSFVGFLN